MKKLFAIIILALFLNGCIALDIVDIFTGPTPVHYEEVIAFDHKIEKNTTILFFADGTVFKVKLNAFVRIGSKVKVFKKMDGSYWAEVK